MNDANELHRHYAVLGLRFGATPEEIRSSYRRLAKLYHPDRDSSLDAEMRYGEIRASYEVLRDWHLSGKKDRSPGLDANGDAGWRAEDWATEYDDIDWNELVHGKTNARVKNRIPFSFAALPKVFIESLKELIAPGILLQLLLAAWLVSWSYGPDFRYVGTPDSLQEELGRELGSSPGYIRQSGKRVPVAEKGKPYKNLVWGITLVSWLLFVPMRYYVALRRMGLFICFGSIAAYSGGVALIVRQCYPHENVAPVLACTMLASLLLAGNPLDTLLKALSASILKRKKRI